MFIDYLQARNIVNLLQNIFSYYVITKTVERKVLNFSRILRFNQSVFKITIWIMSLGMFALFPFHPKYKAIFGEFLSLQYEVRTGNISLFVIFIKKIYILLNVSIHAFFYLISYWFLNLISKLANYIAMPRRLRAEG